VNEERFYVLEQAGWRRPGIGNTHGKMPTEVMVLDRFYCHRVIWSRWSGSSSPNLGIYGFGPLEQVRAEAQQLCDRLNREERLEAAA
jgi:hypothetical protein